MKIQGILCLFLVVLGCGGCSSSQIVAREPQVSRLVTPGKAVPAQPPQSTLPLLSPTLDRLTPASTGSPAQADDSWMTPIAPGLQALVEKAREDLSKRFSIPVVEISLAEAAGVTWSDSSLGCPQEGLFYAQVLTPRYRILLEYANNQYEYHAGMGPDVYFCMNPIPPVPGAPEKK